MSSPPFLSWQVAHRSPPRLALISDPVVVLVLAISFVFSVVVLHVGSKLARIFLK